MKQRPIKTYVARFLPLIFMGMLAAMPFHAFLSVWASEFTGHYRLVQLWKEFLLISLYLTLLLTYGYRSMVSQLERFKPLFVAIAAYFILTIYYGLFAYLAGEVGKSALFFSLITNLRLMAALILGYLIATAGLGDWVKKWPRIIIIPAVVVLVFGLLQASVLPPAFLENFGYSKDTILPYQFVDNDPEYLRVQSTLRGANPLGAYLVIIVSTALVFILSRRIHRTRWIVFGLLSSTVLFYTYSRSAIIGTILSALFIIGWWLYRDPKRRYRAKHFALLITAGILCAAAIIGWWIQRSDFVQNVVLHTDLESSSEATSNEVRRTSIESALRDVTVEPWGRGPGTAGPASVHNNNQSRISENYYLQLAQEIGVIGLLLFLYINILIAAELWRRRNQTLALVLFSSLIGISFINLLSHAWTDSTLAYLWWGLAGIAVGMPTAGILKRKHERFSPEEKRAA